MDSRIRFLSSWVISVDFVMSQQKMFVMWLICCQSTSSELSKAMMSPSIHLLSDKSVRSLFIPSSCWYKMSFIRLWYIFTVVVVLNKQNNNSPVFCFSSVTLILDFGADLYDCHNFLILAVAVMCLFAWWSMHLLSCTQHLLTSVSFS